MACVILNCAIMELFVVLLQSFDNCQLSASFNDQLDEYVDIRLYLYLLDSNALVLNNR